MTPVAPTKKVFWVRALCVALSGFYFFTNCAFAHTAETNFWAEREKALESLQRAALPSLAPSQSVDTTLQNPKNSPASFSNNDLASLLPPSLGHFSGKIPPTNHGPLVIHVQDVHLNAEAQSNIDRALKLLVQKGGVKLIATEGAFGAIDLENFHQFPHQDAVRDAADQLLDNCQITGALHASVVSNSVNLLGIDDQDHYKRNVHAYQDSQKALRSVQVELEAYRRRLETAKKSELNQALQNFDDLVERLDTNQMQLADFLEQLDGASSGSSQLRLFRQASHLEHSLNFPAAEQQRTALLTRLTKSLSPAESRALLEAGIQYRSGSLSHAQFYWHISELCTRHNIDLDHFTQIRDYIRYVLMSEQISAEALDRDVRSFINENYSKLAHSMNEQARIRQTIALRLARKLLAFSLSREEWDQLQSAQIQAALQQITGGNLPMAAFENFYREAKFRDARMADNLLAALQKAGNTPVVLVTGGFHSTGIGHRLAAKKIATVAWTPRLTHASDSDSSYLSVFTQEKTPLQRIFDGDQLFLSPPVYPRSVQVALESQVVANVVNANAGSKADAEESAQNSFSQLDPALKKEFELRGSAGHYAVDVSGGWFANTGDKIKKNFGRLFLGLGLLAALPDVHATTTSVNMTFISFGGVATWLDNHSMIFAAAIFLGGVLFRFFMVRGKYFQSIHWERPARTVEAVALQVPKDANKHLRDFLKTATAPIKIKVPQSALSSPGFMNVHRAFRDNLGQRDAKLLRDLASSIFFNGGKPAEYQFKHTEQRAVEFVTRRTLVGADEVISNPDGTRTYVFRESPRLDDSEPSIKLNEAIRTIGLAMFNLTGTRIIETGRATDASMIVALLTFGSMTNRVNLSQGDIVALSTTFASDSPWTRTADDGALANGFFGGVTRSYFLPGMGPKLEVFSVPFLNKMKTQNFIDHTMVARVASSVRPDLPPAPPYLVQHVLCNYLLLLKNLVQSPLAKPSDRRNLELFSESLRVTQEYENALKAEDMQSAQLSIQRYSEILETLCHSWMKLLVQGQLARTRTGQENVPAHAIALADQVFSNGTEEPDYLYLRRLWDVFGPDMRLINIYTPGVAREIQTEASSQNITVMPMPDAGPDLPLMVFSPRGKKAVELFLTKLKTEGRVVDYAPVAIDYAPIKFEGFKNFEEPAPARTTTYDQLTGVFLNNLLSSNLLSAIAAFATSFVAADVLNFAFSATATLLFFVIAKILFCVSIAAHEFGHLLGDPMYNKFNARQKIKSLGDAFHQRDAWHFFLSIINGTDIGSVFVPNRTPGERRERLQVRGGVLMTTGFLLSSVVIFSSAFYVYTMIPTPVARAVVLLSLLVMTVQAIVFIYVAQEWRIRRGRRSHFSFGENPDAASHGTFHLGPMTIQGRLSNLPTSITEQVAIYIQEAQRRGYDSVVASRVKYEVVPKIAASLAEHGATRVKLDLIADSKSVVVTIEGEGRPLEPAEKTALSSLLKAKEGTISFNENPVSIRISFETKQQAVDLEQGERLLAGLRAMSVEQRTDEIHRYEDLINKGILAASDLIQFLYLWSDEPALAQKAADKIKELTKHGAKDLSPAELIHMVENEKGFLSGETQQWALWHLLLDPRNDAQSYVAEKFPHGSLMHLSSLNKAVITDLDGRAYSLNVESDPQGRIILTAFPKGLSWRWRKPAARLEFSFDGAKQLNGNSRALSMDELRPAFSSARVRGLLNGALSPSDPTFSPILQRVNELSPLGSVLRLQTDAPNDPQFTEIEQLTGFKVTDITAATPAVVTLTKLGEGSAQSSKRIVNGFSLLSILYIARLFAIPNWIVEEAGWHRLGFLITGMKVDWTLSRVLPRNLGFREVMSHNFQLVPMPKGKNGKPVNDAQVAISAVIAPVAWLLLAISFSLVSSFVLPDGLRGLSSIHFHGLGGGAILFKVVAWDAAFVVLLHLSSAVSGMMANDWSSSDILKFAYWLMQGHLPQVTTRPAYALHAPTHHMIENYRAGFDRLTEPFRRARQNRRNAVVLIRRILAYRKSYQEKFISSSDVSDQLREQQEIARESDLSGLERALADHAATSQERVVTDPQKVVRLLGLVRFVRASRYSFENDDDKLFALWFLNRFESDVQFPINQNDALKAWKADKNWDTLRNTVSGIENWMDHTALHAPQIIFRGFRRAFAFESNQTAEVREPRSTSQIKDPRRSEIENNVAVGLPGSSSAGNAPSIDTNVSPTGPNASAESLQGLNERGVGSEKLQPQTSGDSSQDGAQNGRWGRLGETYSSSPKASSQKFPRQKRPAWPLAIFAAVIRSSRIAAHLPLRSEKLSPLGDTAQNVRASGLTGQASRASGAAATTAKASISEKTTLGANREMSASKRENEKAVAAQSGPSNRNTNQLAEEKSSMGVAAATPNSHGLVAMEVVEFGVHNVAGMELAVQSALELYHTSYDLWLRSIRQENQRASDVSGSSFTRMTSELQNLWLSFYSTARRTWLAAGNVTARFLNGRWSSTDKSETTHDQLSEGVISFDLISQAPVLRVEKQSSETHGAQAAAQQVASKDLQSAASAKNAKTDEKHLLTVLSALGGYLKVKSEGASARTPLQLIDEISRQKSARAFDEEVFKFLFTLIHSVRRANGFGIYANESSPAAGANATEKVFTPSFSQADLQTLSVFADILGRKIRREVPVSSYQQNLSYQLKIQRKVLEKLLQPRMVAQLLREARETARRLHQQNSNSGTPRGPQNPSDQSTSNSSAGGSANAQSGSSQRAHGDQSSSQSYSTVEEITGHSQLNDAATGEAHSNEGRTHQESTTQTNKSSSKSPVSSGAVGQKESTAGYFIKSVASRATWENIFDVRSSRGSSSSSGGQTFLASSSRRAVISSTLWIIALAIFGPSNVLAGTDGHTAVLATAGSVFMPALIWTSVLATAKALTPQKFRKRSDVGAGTNLSALADSVLNAAVDIAGFTKDASNFARLLPHVASLGLRRRFVLDDFLQLDAVRRAQFAALLEEKARAFVRREKLSDIDAQNLAQNLARLTGAEIQLSAVAGNKNVLLVAQGSGHSEQTVIQDVVKKLKDGQKLFVLVNTNDFLELDLWVKTSGLEQRVECIVESGDKPLITEVGGKKQLNLRTLEHSLADWSDDQIENIVIAVPFGLVIDTSGAKMLSRLKLTTFILLNAYLRGVVVDRIGLQNLDILARVLAGQA